MTASEKLKLLAARGERGLIVFFTAGDQPLSELPEIVAALADGGADIIEIGIPFSDPFGEGPTIQASSQRALDRGTTPELILAAIAKCKTQVPLVTMGYYNPILRMGLDAFTTRSHSSGCVGTIISDLVPDEAEAWQLASERAGLETIYLVAPTSTPQRIEEVCRLTTGFVYAVSRTGVTGAENQVPFKVGALIAKVRQKTNRPVVVGFGISTPDHVRMVCESADGAVVGSALVTQLYTNWNHGKGKDVIVEFVRTLKAATLPAV